MVKDSRKAILVMLAVAALLAGCAPAQTNPEQVQSMVATSVAMTVQAQNNMALSVAQTLTAQAPLPSPTASFTPVPLELPASDPAVATVTPFVIVPPSGGSSSGGGGSAAADYACSWREVKPKTNKFSPGDAIDIVWVFTNTGTKQWMANLDLDYVSGTKISPFMGEELPPLKPGDSFTVSFEGNAPMKDGLYGEQYKVEGGLCWPALNIQVGPTKKDP